MGGGDATDIVSENLAKPEKADYCAFNEENAVLRRRGE
jgi:hypothetical protein